MKLLHQGNHSFQFHTVSNLDYTVHVHNAVEIVVALSGTSRVLCGREHYALAAGDVFISFPNRVHGYEDSRDFRGYLLILPLQPHLTPYRSQLTGKLPVTPLLHRQDWDFDRFLTLLELAHGEKDSCGEAVLQAYLQVMVGKLLQQLTLVDAQAVPADALASVLMYVNQNYTTPVSREAVAKATGYTPGYISHLFRDALGTSLTDYITALRLLDARNMLADTALSVSRIAMQLGFGSIRSFNRVFAQKEGCSPTLYRHRLTHADEGRSL